MTWSLPGLVARHAEEAPDGLALVDGETRWTWRALSARADAWAVTLPDRGVRPGDRVALAIHPSADFVAAIVGVLRAGAVVAPIPSGLTARETDVACEVLAPVATLRDGDAAAGAPTSAAASADPDPEAPAVIVLTSGTTGRPKGVVLSGRAMAASADAWLAVLPPATGWALPLALAHVAGLGHPVAGGTRPRARDDAPGDRPARAPRRARGRWRAEPRVARPRPARPAAGHGA